ncbi:MAG: ribbon-helix-helix domain-containing protein [Acetobacteraceae bacterium]
MRPDLVLEKRSVTLSGHRTSVALEPEFWLALAVIAARGGRTLSALIAETDALRRPDRPLASSLRVLALQQRPIASGGIDPPG